MPKIKTNRSAAKRFYKSGTGKILRRKAFKSHILEKKSARRKRDLGRVVEVDKGDVQRIKRLIPYV